MAVICPTVTASDAHDYREQVVKLEAFADRIHLDFADGSLTDNKLFSLEHAWTPAIFRVDIHIMSKDPLSLLDYAIRLKPSLVIVHAEAGKGFSNIAKKLHSNGIRAGVALLQETEVSKIEPDKTLIDHVLIFSGKLGHYGGIADLTLLDKVKQVKASLPLVEIAWDGGINAEVATALVDGGVDVLNVGGYIQHSENPSEAYAKLKQVVNEHKS